MTTVPHPTTYNSMYKTKKECIGRPVSVCLTYERIVAIANVLHDLHSELDKPQNERFKNYPQKELEPLHQEIHDACVNATLSMERVVYDEQNGNG